MLRLLATLSPTAVLLAGALAGAVPVGGLAYLAGKLIGDHAGYKRGSSDMQAAVEKQNTTAATAARTAKTKVDACYDSGGTWNQESGRCDR